MSEAVHILTHEFLPFRGGIGVYVEETALALARSGFGTTVWAPDYGQALTDAFPFEIRRIPMRGKQDWLCRLRLARALRAAFPDGRMPGTVILAEPGPIRLWMYARPMRLPRPDRLVVILHGSEILNLSRPPYRRARLQHLLRQASCVGVVSEEVRTLLRAICPEVAKRAVLVPGAVRSAWSDLPISTSEKSSAAASVLQVGRLHPRKGQHILVEAVARLPASVRSRVQVRLVGPVGKADYAKQVQSRIRELDLPVNVEGVLDEEQLKGAYTASHILVMPSRPHASSVEGLGLALLEAAHFGCAVVGSRVGGIPEALRDGETGLLVPPDDPEALAAALARLLSDDPLAVRMGAAGAAFVRNTFSWDRNARILMNSEHSRD